MGKIITNVLAISLLSAGLFLYGRLTGIEEGISIGEKLIPAFTAKIRLESPSPLINMNEILLPQPQRKSETSLEETLQKRRSIREYKNEPLSLKDMAQILWASQGITEGYHRTVPSAGALYPIEIYLVVKNVEGVAEGVYCYDPKDHKLALIVKGDFSKALAEVAANQQWIEGSAAVLLISADFEKTTQKYGERGKQYVWMEAGHSAQNVYLQAISLELGTVSVGAFKGERVQKILNLPESILPLVIMPIGKK
ncbi:MAG: SagB/ThcOx family dehydrogenase [bacterium]